MTEPKKVWVSKDERYPDYCYSIQENSYDKPLMLTYTEIGFIDQAMADYEKAQDMLRQAYE